MMEVSLLPLSLRKCGYVCVVLFLQRSKMVILGGLVRVMMRNEGDGGGRMGRTRRNLEEQRENLREREVGTLVSFW